MEEKTRKRSTSSKPSKGSDRKISKDGQKNPLVFDEKSVESSCENLAKVCKSSDQLSDKNEETILIDKVNIDDKTIDKLETNLDNTEVILHHASAVEIRSDENIDNIFDDDIEDNIDDHSSTEDPDQHRYTATPVFAHDFEEFEFLDSSQEGVDAPYFEEKLDNLGSCRPKIDELNLTLENFDVQR